MSNTINLLPVQTKDQIKQEVGKFKFDFLTSVVIMVIVVVGVVLMFVQAFLQFNITNINNNITTATNTLNSYKSLDEGYYLVDTKVQQLKVINNYKVDPTTVIDYLSNLVPSGSNISNFTLSQNNQFTLTISNTDYIAVAKFLVVLEEPNLDVKGTEIQSIDYDTTQNIYNFIISGDYVKNG
jgi:hypothetical protein